MAIELLAGARKEGESGKAVIACNDYLRMGPGRALRALHAQYCQQAASKPPAPKVPTKRLETLFAWSAEYGWAERAATYDAEIERQKTAAVEAARMAELNDGLALDFERVRKLKSLAEFLEAEIKKTDDAGNQSNVWLPDVKSIGSGEFAERIDIVRFNSALIEQYRGTLDDLAKETGGRVKKTDVTTGGEKLKGYIGFSPDDWDDGDTS